MALAWKHVRANRGRTGEDGRSIADTADYLKKTLAADSGKPAGWQPPACAGAPCADSETRWRYARTGDSTVTDRLIQQALLQVLQPLIDPMFSAHSYGFRPMALNRAMPIAYFERLGVPRLS
ncbi:hypothetical protein ACFS3C_17050 [Azotobacter vinelandii]